jgi:hypothetical protein
VEAAETDEEADEEMDMGDVDEADGAAPDQGTASAR